LRLMAIRQAGLESPALSASARERMVYGPTAASEEKRMDFSAPIARFGNILNRERPLVAIGPRYQLRPPLVRPWIPNSRRCQHFLSALGPFLAA